MPDEETKKGLLIGARISRPELQEAKRLARTKGFVHCTEVAAALGVDKRTPHAWRNRHESFPETVMFRGLRFFPLDEVVAWYNRFAGVEAVAKEFDAVFGALDTPSTDGASPAA